MAEKSTIMQSDLSGKDGAQLHSRYNPQLEAVRYISSLSLNPNTEYFILIEPGEGYMIPVLQEKFPNSKIIALYVNDPEPEEKLDKELTLNTLQQNTPAIKIIEWRPSMNYYKDAYVKLLSKTVKYVKRFEAEKRTVSFFGKRWVNNFFRNIGNINSALLYKKTDIPVIITGSGPSLESALLDIKKIQENCLIIAASSSVMALGHNGIKPDLVIATDGGGWAVKHLYPFYRYYGNNTGGLAITLCAALPSQCYNTPALLLNDGSLWQSVILHELQLPSVLIPQRGTVTASAIDLALQLTSGNIYLAGLDLAVNDIQTHIKPYVFDNMFLEKSTRYSPLYSQYFTRSSLIKEGGSMDIYAEWFKTQYGLWPKRIYNLNDYSGQALKKTGEYFKNVPVRCKNGIDILLAALKNSIHEKDLRAELEPLLGKDIENYLSSLHALAASHPDAPQGSIN
ncbi:MAG: DUF115 domain-containing protein [Treponema sp.]|jgi:hypothetical protein|nr:DUF115 domain-containing protein [Treponema sp.]